MPARALHPSSAPWLRLTALVLLAHAVALMSLPPRPTPASRPPSVSHWTTRLVAAPVYLPKPTAHGAAGSAGAAATARDPSFAPPSVHPARAPDAPKAVRAKAAQPTAPHAPARTRPRLPTTALADSATPAPHRRAESTLAPGSAVEPAAQHRAASALPPVTVPAAASLVYDVAGTSRGLAYQAQSHLHWRPMDGRYEAEWQTQGASPQRFRRWHSQGLLTGTGLAPQRFAETTRSERAAHFDAEGGRVRFSANTPDADWLPGGQDRLSVVLQLAGMLAAAPGRYPAGSAIVVQTASAREATASTWTVQDDEALDVMGQTVPCAVLLHRPDGPYEPVTTLWLAKPLGYLPARLRSTYAQGDTVEHRLQSLAPLR